MKIEHYQLISELYRHLISLFPQAFISTDLFWYPLIEAPQLCIAPDLFIALNQGSETRLYHEISAGRFENCPGEKVIFDVLMAEAHQSQQLARKLLFYQQIGVQEYYLYDFLEAIWYGYQRKAGLLQPIVPLANWTSPLLGIQFLPPPSSKISHWAVRFPQGKVIASNKISPTALYGTYDVAMLPQLGQYNISLLIKSIST
jgi:hypothetical protein